MWDEEVEKYEKTVEMAGRREEHTGGNLIKWSGWISVEEVIDSTIE